MIAIASRPAPGAIWSARAARRAARRWRISGGGSSSSIVDLLCESKSESTMAARRGPHERHPLKKFTGGSSPRVRGRPCAKALFEREAEPTKPSGGYHTRRGMSNPSTRIYLQIKGEKAKVSCLVG